MIEAETTLSEQKSADFKAKKMQMLCSMWFQSDTISMNPHRIVFFPKSLACEEKLVKIEAQWRSLCRLKGNKGHQLIEQLRAVQWAWHAHIDVGALNCEGLDC